MKRGYATAFTTASGKPWVSKKQKTTPVVSKKTPVATKSFVRKYVSKQQEHKNYDQAISTTIDYNGTMFSLCDIPQGDTDITRDGDKLMPTSVEINIGVTIADTTNVFRVIVIRWKGYDSVDPPSTSKILEVTGTVYAPYSSLQHDRRDRFELLYDSGVIPLTASDTIKTLNIKLPCAKKEVSFSAGGTGAANKIEWMCISDSAAVFHPAITGYTRTNFTDS